MYVASMTYIDLSSTFSFSIHVGSDHNLIYTLDDSRCTHAYAQYALIQTGFDLVAVPLGVPPFPAEDPPPAGFKLVYSVPPPPPAE